MRGPGAPVDSHRLVIVSALAVLAAVAANVLLIGAATALVLATFPSRVLPPLYGAAAIFGGVVSLAGGQLMSRGGRASRLDIPLVVFAATLAGGWALLASGATWVVLAIHPWAIVLSTLAVGQLYALITDRMDSSQARRLLPRINLGGTVGAMGGGAALMKLAPAIGSAQLLLVAAVLLAGAAAGAVWLQRAGGNAPAASPAASTGAGIGAGLRELGNNRLVRQMALLAALGAVASTVFRFVFEAQLQQSFPRDRIAAFIGMLNLTMNGTALVVQAVAERRLVASFGFLPGLLSVPAVLFAGAGLLFVLPGLWLVTGVRFAENVVRFSITRTAEELVAAPLASLSKRRSRLIIAGFAVPAATLLTSILLAGAGRSGTQELPAVLAFAAAGAALIMAVTFRRPYLDQLREALSRRRLALRSEAVLDLPREQARRVVLEHLRADAAADVRLALQMAAACGVALDHATLQPFLSHPEPTVRMAALQLVAARPDPSLVAAVRGLLEREPDPDVVLTARTVLEGDDAIPRLVAAIGERRHARLAEELLLTLDPGRATTELLNAAEASVGRARQRLITGLARLPAQAGLAHERRVDGLLRADLRRLVTCKIVAAGAPSPVVAEAEVQRRAGEETVLSLVSLTCPGKDVRMAQLSFATAEPRQRALALDVLRQVLPAPVAAIVIPVLELTDAAQLAAHAATHLGTEMTAGGWQPLIDSSGEPWCRLVALHLLGSAPRTEEERRIMPHLDHLFVLRRIELFSEVSPDDLLRIAELSRTREIAAGTPVFRQGDAGDAFYLVLSGQLAVERDGKIIATLGEHDWFGETALLQRGPRTATVVARSDCELSCIEGGDFDDLIDTHPAIARAMLTVLARRLSATV